MPPGDARPEGDPLKSYEVIDFERSLALTELAADIDFLRIAGFCSLYHLRGAFSGYGYHPIMVTDYQIARVNNQVFEKRRGIDPAGRLSVFIGAADAQSACENRETDLSQQFVIAHATI